MKKRLLLIPLAIIVLLPIAGLLLLNSESGSRWLLQSLLSALPAQTSVTHIEGSLLSQIDVHQLHYETEQELVDIDHVSLHWQPGQLLTGSLKLINISLNELNIVIKQSQPSEPSTFDWSADLPVPVRLILENLSITNLHYQDGETQFELQEFKISALTEKNQLIINSLLFAAQPFTAQAQGRVTLGKQFPLNLSSQWQFADAEYGDWQAETQLTGDVNNLIITSQQSSPFKLTLNAKLENLQHQLVMAIRGDWQQLSWPLAGKPPQFSSKQGFFEINGGLDAYKLTLAGPLTQDYLPGATLNFNGQGSTEGLQIDDLQIASDAGSLQVNGKVNWRDATVFEVNASGKQFNPAIFSAELPGKLTFDTHINGTLDDKTTDIQLAIKQLNGELRGNPVTGSGKLAMHNETIDIDALKLVSGKNRIDANGRLAPQQSDLQFKIDAPALAGLWPDLRGSLQGSGHLQGNWQNPQLLMQVKGSGLRYAEHALDKLAIDIDYQPDKNTQSKLLLVSGRIKSGDTVIDSLRLEGAGNLTQHQLTLDMQSPLASVATSLSGAMNDKVWLGNLKKLTLNSQDFGNWQLPSATDIQLTQHDAGIETRLSDTCLVQKTASVCFSAHTQANSDFTAQLKASEVPTSLINSLLPAPWQLKGSLNAQADVRQQQGILSGNYRLDMPAPNKVLFKQGKTSQELALGGLKVIGNLKNNLISANIDLGLLGNDFVRGQLEFNNNASQALSGQINAAIKDWDLILALAPEISKLTGQLDADLELSGRLTDPVIAGRLDLKQANIELADQGFALQNLDLQVQADKGKSQIINLNGAVNPVLLAKTKPEDATQFKGRITISAELQQKPQLAGHYRLDLPADSSVSFKTAATRLSIPFAPSSLSGEIKGEQISANLDLLMLNQDFLRAKLQADTGARNTLSGQVNASIKDLGLLDALIPDLAHTKGQIKADLAITGTMAQPIANGSIKLSQGSTSIEKLGIAPYDINLQLVSADQLGERMQLTGSAKSADGQLNLNGMTTLAGIADITLQGKDFEVAKLPEAQVSISPNLHIDLTETGTKINGRLDIPKAIITMQELPASAVTVSEDEIILGQTETEKPSSSTAFKLDANIEVELGKQVRFSGQGLDTDLSGRLKISKSADSTSMHGTIDMKKARYQSYGQDLTVRKGRFLFNGPVEAPWLDVEAIRVSKNQDVTAILSLTGPLKSPKTRIYSEPALPESEALAYLITGSSLNQVGKSDGNMVASAALSYGAGQLSWLTDKLGVDEFEVKQGKTLQDTLMTVGQYLTPDFYVGTKVGIFNRQAMLVLKHKLTKTINLETQTGTSQRVKLNYEIDTD